MCHNGVTLAGRKPGDLFKHPSPFGCNDDRIFEPQPDRGHLVQIHRRARRTTQRFLGTAGPHNRVQPAARIVRSGPRTHAIEQMQVGVLDDVIRGLGPVSEPTPGKRHQLLSKGCRVKHQVLRRSPAGHCLDPFLQLPPIPMP
jgi:hypothetical protein